MPKVLIVDDEKAIRETLKEILQFEGFETVEAEDGPSALQKFGAANDFDVVLCDIKMPKMDGIEVLQKLQEMDPDTPVIMLTGHGNTETAIDATRKGAYDFLQKPPDLNRLLITLRNATEKTNLVSETKVLKRKVSKTREIIGESSAINKIIDTIDKVAPTDARVMVTGQNGTGKELVARWIHERSNRAAGPLVEVNCAAIPSELIESELFGHEKGSFTSAIKQRIGKFEQANGGTLFLDEVGDMSLSAQAKVLRALQENKITRVGGDKDIDVNVRVICATNKDLISEIDHNTFRLDLYHRISVILIHLPSLNERVDDIPLLAENFLAEVCEDNKVPIKAFTPEALEEMKKVNWSGNIRELRNVIERFVILCGPRITDLDVRTYTNPTRGTSTVQGLLDSFTKFQSFKDHTEKIFIQDKLRKNNWNVAKTASEIDIQRSHLYNKIDKFSLNRDDE